MTASFSSSVLRSAVTADENSYWYLMLIMLKMVTMTMDVMKFLV